MLPLDLKAFAAAAGWDNLPEDVASRRFERTAEDPTFPGAILPCVGPDGTVSWYGLAANAADWRRLQPLLLAYAGPTITSFTGQTTTSDPGLPAERFLQGAGIQIMARLVPAAGPGGLKWALFALDRLCDAIARRPPATQTVQESTPRLLSRLDMCLVAGNREAAETLLDQLRTELRLDTLNLHFLQVRILASFRAWRELIEATWFRELCWARKPAAVAAAMLEALWRVYLAEIASDETQLAQHYRDAVQSLARPLLAQTSEPASEFVQRLHALENPRPIADAQPLEAAAQELLNRAADAPSNAHLAQALAAIESLPKPARQTLLHSGAGQQAVAEIGSLDRPAPGNWMQWLDALADTRFDNAATVAREGVTQWPADNLASTAQAASLAEGLLRIGLSGGVGASRLIESLATLVLWVKEDRLYPRPALASIYEALLQLFDLLERRRSTDRDAAADLFEALLSLGTTKDGYRRLLSDFSKLIEAGAGTSSVYWLIEVAAGLLGHPAPDPDARLTLLNQLLGSFQTFLALLTPGQRAAYQRIATGAGWPVLPTPVGPATTPALETLRGQSLAIYTLTESAGRQAEAALKEIVPTLRIELAHDHVASPRLVRLARESDVFVLTTASAKHAATDCIVTHRGSRPLLYAAGRGFTSIVRAVEDYAERSSRVDSSEE